MNNNILGLQHILSRTSINLCKLSKTENFVQVRKNLISLNFHPILIFLCIYINIKAIN